MCVAHRERLGFHARSPLKDRGELLEEGWTLWGHWLLGHRLSTEHDLDWSLTPLHTFKLETALGGCRVGCSTWMAAMVSS